MEVNNGDKDLEVHVIPKKIHYPTMEMNGVVVVEGLYNIN